MQLRELLRNEWSEYIRPLIIKDSCEFCGSKEDIHLHHIDRFHNLLVETLEELHLQELDTEFYDEMELKQISNFMLAKQIKSEYKTLCKKCHMKIHSKEKYKDEYREHYYNPNGGYLFINSDSMTTIDIEHDKFLRLLRIACSCNYDGYLTDGKRKIILCDNKSLIIKNCEKLIDILNISEREVRKTIEYLLHSNFINICDDGSLMLNKNIISKGHNNYKNKIKLFINPFIEIYNNVDGCRKHKFIGKLFMTLLISNERVECCDLGDKTNSSKTKKYLSTIVNLCKNDGNNIIINPSILYDGELDHSYKKVLNEYEEL